MENNRKRKYSECNFEEYDSSKPLDQADGKLRTEDGCSFPIHKDILAKASRFFSDLLCNMSKEPEEILLPRIKGENLFNILCYLYTGNIRVNEGNILDLIVASDFLQMDDLLVNLKKHVRRCLTVTNCLPIFRMFLEIIQDSISKEIFRFIQMHFESIVRCEDSKISELPLEALKLILRDKNLRMKSKNIVWLSIVKWVQAYPQDRLASVPDLLKQLAISDVDEVLANEILQHDIVAKNPCCQEIYQGKSLISAADNLRYLQCYFQTYSETTTTLYEHMQPSKLNLICSYNPDSGTDDIQVYVTYDESIDLWRKLFEIDPTPHLLFAFNNCIYMYKSYRNRVLRYNIIQKQWEYDVDFSISDDECQTVELHGLLYLLEPNDVKAYDPESDEWSSLRPMEPVTSYIAVAHNDIIYVVGYNDGYNVRSTLGNEMIAQAFDPSIGLWKLLPSPSIPRVLFTMVLYRGLIYVIGGFRGVGDYLTEVEVFDPMKNEWSAGVNLPHAYYVPKAIILDDKLIVYDHYFFDRSINRFSPQYPPVDYPPVQWNVHQKRWETKENSSMNKLGMYSFLPIENSKCINIISRENKDPATRFEYSPFA